MDPMNLGALIDSTIGQLLHALQAQSGVFVNLGLTFLGLAAILSLLTGVYTWWASGSIQDLVQNLVRLVLLAAPVIFILHGWSDYTKTFENFFSQGLPSLLGVQGGSPAQIVGNAISSLMQSVQLPSSTQSSSSGFFSSLKDMFSLSTLYSLFFYGVNFLLACFLVFGLIFAVFMPMAGLYLGAIFGPILIAWLPWKPLATMPGRWLGFMIGNGITFAVAVTIVNALSGTIATMTQQMQGMAASGALTGVAGFAVSLLALFAIYLFATDLLMQANNMASGMTGGATTGEGMFGAIAGAVGGAAMLATAKATPGVPGAVVKDTAKMLGAAGASVGKAGEAMSGSKLGAVRGAGAALTTAHQAGQNVIGALAASRSGKAAIALSNVAKAGASAAKGSNTFKNLDRPITRSLGGGKK